VNIENLSPGTIRTLAGAVLILLGIVTANVYSPIVGLALIALGIIAIWCVIETGKQKEVLKAYRTLIRKGESLNLTLFAESVGMEQEEVKRYLVELSRQKKIPPLKFVNHPEGPQAQRQSPAQSAPSSPSSAEIFNTDQVYAAEDVQPLLTAVRCRGCGATVQIRRGEVAECEHCGNPLTI